MDKQVSPIVLRLTIKLYQDEYPLLLKDLLKARKGQRRTVRLATLASIGLLAERNVIGMNTVHVDSPVPPADLWASAGARGAEALGEGGLSDEDVASLFDAPMPHET